MKRLILWGMRSFRFAVLLFLSPSCIGNVAVSIGNSDGGDGGGLGDGGQVSIGNDRDAGRSSDGGTSFDAGDKSDAGSGRIPVFVAQGMVGRTTLSCDDGLTWVGDRAWDIEGDAWLCGSTTPVECFATGSRCNTKWYDGTCSSQSPCDCGHSNGFSKGIVFDGDFFVAAWGWGYPGSVRRSRDGVMWQTTLDGLPGFGGLAYGAGHFVAADRSPKISRDGLNWSDGGAANFSGPNEPIIWSVRRFAYAPVDTGRFVAIASGNTDRDILISSDHGESWWRPDAGALPSACGQSVGAYGDIIGGNGIIVMMGSAGNACSSADFGKTWTLSDTGDTFMLSSGVWTGTEFWFWSRTHRYSSTDGVKWSAVLTNPSPIGLGPVARGPNGTLVAANSVWSGYGQQRFLRSTDGINWQTLPQNAFNPSHPIFFITFGYAQKSSVCP